MKKQPKIKIEVTLHDKILEIIGWLLLFYLWYLAVSSHLSFPEKIPVHFDAFGNLGSYGNKNFIYLLPVIGTLLFTGMTLLNKVPHIFNYPVKITQENAETQYRLATRLLRYLKLTIVLSFLIIVFTTIKIVEDNSTILNKWLLPLILILIFLPVIQYFRSALKNK